MQPGLRSHVCPCVLLEHVASFPCFLPIAAQKSVAILQRRPRPQIEWRFNLTRSWQVKELAACLLCGPIIGPETNSNFNPMPNRVLGEPSRVTGEDVEFAAQMGRHPKSPCCSALPVLSASCRTASKTRAVPPSQKWGVSAQNRTRAVLNLSYFSGLRKGRFAAASPI